MSKLVKDTYDPWGPNAYATPEVHVQLDAYLSDAETLAVQWESEG